MEEIVFLKSKIATLEGTMATMRQDAILREKHLARMGERYKELKDYCKYLQDKLEEGGIEFDKLPYV